MTCGHRFFLFSYMSDSTTANVESLAAATELQPICQHLEDEGYFILPEIYMDNRPSKSNAKWTGLGDAVFIFPFWLKQAIGHRSRQELKKDGLVWHWMLKFHTDHLDITSPILSSHKSITDKADALFLAFAHSIKEEFCDGKSMVDLFNLELPAEVSQFEQATQTAVSFVSSQAPPHFPDIFVELQVIFSKLLEYTVTKSPKTFKSFYNGLPGIVQQYLQFSDFSPNGDPELFDYLKIISYAKEQSTLTFAAAFEHLSDTTKERLEMIWKGTEISKMPLLGYVLHFSDKERRSKFLSELLEAKAMNQIPVDRILKTYFRIRSPSLLSVGEQLTLFFREDIVQHKVGSAFINLFNLLVADYIDVARTIPWKHSPKSNFGYCHTEDYIKSVFVDNKTLVTHLGSIVDLFDESTSLFKDATTFYCLQEILGFSVGQNTPVTLTDDTPLAVLCTFDDTHLAVLCIFEAVYEMLKEDKDFAEMLQRKNTSLEELNSWWISVIECHQQRKPLAAKGEKFKAVQKAYLKNFPTINSRLVNFCSNVANKNCSHKLGIGFSSYFNELNSESKPEIFLTLNEDGRAITKNVMATPILHFIKSKFEAQNPGIEIKLVPSPNKEEVEIYKFILERVCKKVFLEPKTVHEDVRDQWMHFSVATLNQKQKKLVNDLNGKKLASLAKALSNWPGTALSEENMTFLSEVFQKIKSPKCVEVMLRQKVYDGIVVPISFDGKGIIIDSTLIEIGRNKRCVAPPCYQHCHFFSAAHHIWAEMVHYLSLDQLDTKVEVSSTQQLPFLETETNTFPTTTITTTTTTTAATTTL